MIRALLFLPLLAACASLPGTRGVVLVPPYVSPHLDASVAAKAADALRRVLTYDALGWRAQGLFEAGYDEALKAVDYSNGLADPAQVSALGRSLNARVGLVDLIPGPSGVVVTFRVVDGGIVSAGFRVEVPAKAAWDWAFLQALHADSRPLSGAADLDAALDNALRAQDGAEALRLAEIAEDLRPSGLLAAVSADVVRSRAEALTQAIAASLKTPRGSAGAETRLWAETLERLRDAAPFVDAGSQPAVTAAYKARFGRELSTQVDRPEWVVVDGGTYFQGSSQEADEEPVHQGTAGDLLVSRTEITQAQYEAVTGDHPSLFTAANDAPRRPVERVTWYDAVEFCNKLSVLDGLKPVYGLTARSPAAGYPIVSAEVAVDRTADGYRLPTETEWEWLARGGRLARAEALAGSDHPFFVAWTDGRDGPQPVAEKQPNELGLYDLSGNVWEWCEDWYAPYAGGKAGIVKVGRGGSWHAAAWSSRVTARSFDNPGARSANVGFRVVRSIPSP